MHSVDDDSERIASTRYIDRELSWLEFNARVLALAENESLPLLERAKFLAIFSSNLDEFFQVRVSGLTEQLEAGIRPTSEEGIDQLEQFERDPGPRRRARHPAGGRVHQRRAARAAGRGDRVLRLARPRRRRPRPDHERVRRTHLPGAHAARGRPRPSVPVHLESLAQPRGGRTRREHGRATVRPREGAAAPPAVRRGAEQLTLRRPRTGDRGPPRRAVPRNGGAGALRVPRHARCRLRALRRCRGPARGHGIRAPPAHEVRCRGAARGRRRDDTRGTATALPRARAGTGGRLRDRQSARPQRADGALQPAPTRAEVRRVHAADACAAHRGRRRRHLPRHARRRCLAPPPVRHLQRHRRGLRRPGRARPASARDQADPVPHRRRRGGHRGVTRQGGRGRQAGRRVGRAQSPLRGTGEHRTGSDARAGGRPRRVRPRRPEDPREDPARRPPGTRRHPALLPRRDRQLQPEDRGDLRGPRRALGRRRARRRHLGALQPPHRLQPPR